MDDEIKKIIEENPLALATVDKENKPHVIAVADVKVMGGKLIITDNYMKKTIENLRNSPNISLVVWNKDWKGYKLKGIAEYFNGGEWLDFVKAIPENKNEPCKGVLVVEINNIKKC